MVRFIDIGNQTEEAEDGVKEFAFYDTVTGKFFEFSGCQKWDSTGEFMIDCPFSGAELDRFLRLIPKGFNITIPLSDQQYVPFGPEWEKQAMKHSKAEIVSMFREVAADRSKLSSLARIFIKAVDVAEKNEFREFMSRQDAIELRLRFKKALELPDLKD